MANIAETGIVIAMFINLLFNIKLYEKNIVEIMNMMPFIICKLLFFI